jgi:triosephosphate isomerase (TIM)
MARPAPMKPLIVGNWKMSTSLEDAERLVGTMLPALRELGEQADIVLCPPFPWLVEVSRALHGSGVSLGAQNFHYAESGGFTGEVSLRMLKGLIQYAIVGQYERRIFFDEKDGIVKRKLLAALQHGVRPILCVGETASDLDDGASGYVVAQQLEAALEDVTIDNRLVIAYEPVWTTIGMIQAPPPSFIGEMCNHIRQTLRDLFPRQATQDVRIIYGGSVAPRNLDDILAQGNADGVLTGSASVNAESFVSIARAFASSVLRAPR